MNAGKLRHRIRIEREDYFYDSNGAVIQDSETGEMAKQWVQFASVWADIQPLSAREFVQSQAIQSQIINRIVIRYIDGLNAAMRLVHLRKGRPNVIYNPAGFLADKESGLEYLTIPCSQGINQG